MAPRRRPGRPPQVSRMAAAVEAMAEMGFEPKLVRQKVNRLLKEDMYGEDGWRFIEDASYSLLLESLLEEQDGDDNRTASLENSKGEKYAETAGAGPSSTKNASPKKSSCGNDIGTSGAAPLSKNASPKKSSCGNDIGTSGAAPLSKNASPKKSSCGNDIGTSGAAPLSKIGSPQADARGVDDAESSLDGPSLSKAGSPENDPSCGIEVETSGPILSSSLRNVLFPCSNLEAVNNTLQSKDNLDSSQNKPLNSVSPTQLPDANNFLLPTEGQSQGQQGTPVTHSGQQVYTRPARRRKPYHGWVGCDDDDFVELQAAPLPEVLRKMFNLTVDSGKRKRKSRCDVQPENM